MERAHRQRVAFGIVALVAFALLALYRARLGLTAPVAHLALAVGAMPLIFTAMAYFTPVLARTPAVTGAVRAVPILALVSGLMVVAGLVHWIPLVYLAAWFALAATTALGAWMYRQSRRAIGGAHPGLAWYLAALACLALALLAVLATSIHPASWLVARRFHLHLNLLGFIGLTAIGTLQVLLPTAGRYQDPTAGMRLRADLKFAVAGALTIAFAAALGSRLMWLGLALWSWPVLRLAAITLIHRTHSAFGAAAPLTGALAGFILVLVAGALHGAHRLAPRPSLALFFFAFLFPLVTGALTHLLPLWLRPQATTREHESMRDVIARGSAARALIFLASGLLVLADQPWGAYLALAALLWFGLRVTLAVTGR